MKLVFDRILMKYLLFLFVLLFKIEWIQGQDDEIELPPWKYDRVASNGTPIQLPSWEKRKDAPNGTEIQLPSWGQHKEAVDENDLSNIQVHLHSHDDDWDAQISFPTRKNEEHNKVKDNNKVKKIKKYIQLLSLYSYIKGRKDCSGEYNSYLMYKLYDRLKEYVKMEKIPIDLTLFKERIDQYKAFEINDEYEQKIVKIIFGGKILTK
uniref:Uncharacterized protein n=1 Tax=Parastrongyloides trichosuri TaxID=131310 RepID=A0A0N4ZQ38_PARTI